MTEVLNREQIISRLQELVTSEQIDLDADHLKKASEDFYRKYPQAHQIYTAARPVAIVYPNNTAEVARILKYANDQRINVIARTGNSSIERGLESAREPHIIVDGSHLNKIVQLDVENQQLTVQAGLPLVIAEKYLNDNHLTTGHLPQSQPLADFGGLVATRSIGQLSTYYGGIEDLLVGLEAVMADGTIIRIKNEPRRSVGPDLRHLFLGSEGALAFITEVTVKVFPYLPQNYHYLAYNVATMRAGFQILRQVMVNGYKPSIIRLYDPVDWSQYFPENKQPILIFRSEGPKKISDATAQGIQEIVQKSSQVTPIQPLEPIIDWFQNLTWDQTNVDQEVQQMQKSPYVGFTTEIAAPWSTVADIFEAVTTRVKQEIPNLLGIGGHSSHSYVNGTNIYFVYAFKVADVAPEEEMARYHDPLNKIIVEETLKHQGSISHHHGIGKARAPYIKQEYGSSYPLLKKLFLCFDPQNTMNAGNIIPLQFMNEKDT